MRNMEIAPKSKTFSRTDSLKYQIQNAIGIYNVGYHRFHIQLLNKLNIPTKTVLKKWLMNKDSSKQQSTINRQKQYKVKQTKETVEKK